MQQQLQHLANLVTLAGQKSLPETQKQLTDLRNQLQLLGSINIHPVMIALINKSIAGLQHRLMNGTDLTDAALMQECQQQAQALFQAYTLINEAAKQFAQLDQNNERAKTNQKYFDQRKNQAREQFNAYLEQVAAKAELNAADLLAFNQRLRDMLERAFQANNLPREAAQPVQPESMRQAPAIQNFMSTLSNGMNAINSNDQEGMKNAASSFVGFLIDMVVESIATLCRKFAPSISPFISQMAQFAKGAIGHLFNSGMQTAAEGQAAASAQAATAAPTAPTQQTTRTAQTTPSTTVPSSTANMGGGLLNAMQQFMQRNGSQPPTAARTAAPKQQQREAANPAKKPSLLGGLVNNAFNRFKQKRQEVAKLQGKTPKAAPSQTTAPTGHPTVGLMPRKPRNQP